MPRNATPKYGLHKPPGQARVILDGPTHYFGKYGTEESKQACRRLISSWLARNRTLPRKSGGLRDLTGMRPGEARMMRGGDLDTSGRIWEYRPAEHKSEQRDKDRVIPIPSVGLFVVKRASSRIIRDFADSLAQLRRRAAVRHCTAPPVAPIRFLAFSSSRRPRRAGNALPAGLDRWRIAVGPPGLEHRGNHVGDRAVVERVVAGVLFVGKLRGPRSRETRTFGREPGRIREAVEPLRPCPPDYLPRLLD